MRNKSTLFIVYLMPALLSCTSFAQSLCPQLFSELSEKNERASTVFNTESLNSKRAGPIELALEKLSTNESGLVLKNSLTGEQIQLSNKRLNEVDLSIENGKVHLAALNRQKETTTQQESLSLAIYEVETHPKLALKPLRRSVIATRFTRAKGNPTLEEIHNSPFSLDTKSGRGIVMLSRLNDQLFDQLINEALFNRRSFSNLILSYDVKTGALVDQRLLKSQGSPLQVKRLATTNTLVSFGFESSMRRTRLIVRDLAQGHVIAELSSTQTVQIPLLSRPFVEIEENSKGQIVAKYKGRRGGVHKVILQSN